jgi:enoyl-CoA hydratase/carnithine racemase
MNLFYKKDVLNFDKQHFSYLIIDFNNHVLSITLNRPEKKNALHPQLLNELAYAFEYANYENSVRAVLIKAKGDVFCSGMDLKALTGDIEKNNSTIPSPNSKILIGELFNKLYKPKLCQLEGDVYAGGFLILAGCNYVISKKNVKLGLPEVKRGIYPMQVMESLSKFISIRNVIDWCIRGYNLDVKTALKWGLISEIISKEKIDKVVRNWLDEVTSNSPEAIKYGLKAMDKISSIESNHKYLSEMLDKVLSSDDAKEGINAFKEKRKPIWK